MNKTHYTVSYWPENFIKKMTVVDEKDFLIESGKLQPREAIKFRSRTICWKNIEPALKKQWPDKYFLVNGHASIWHIICLDDAAEDLLIPKHSTRQMREYREKGGA
jgi:hypothetical protein